jgi:hypothetical protein
VNNLSLVHVYYATGSIKPRLGTDYSCALAKVQDILSVGDASRSDFCFLVFLSDGRPGDLPPQIPPIGFEKETYKVDRIVRPSATARMVSIAKQLKTMLFLNTVRNEYVSYAALHVSHSFLLIFHVLSLPCDYLDWDW